MHRYLTALLAWKRAHAKLKATSGPAFWPAVDEWDTAARTLSDAELDLTAETMAFV